MRALRQALLDHNVIFFRDQELAPPQLLALARRFGEVVEYPFVKGLPECPLVLPIVKEPEERANFGGVWHTDTAYLERPAMATMLYAVETPPVGGDTMFANLYLAWETLSEGLRRVLQGLRAVNIAGKPIALADPRGDAQQARHRGRRRHHQRGPPGRAPPPRDRPDRALRQPRPHHQLRGHDRGRERAAPRLSLRPPDPPGAHLPLRMARRARSRCGTTAAACTTRSTTTTATAA